MLSVINLSTGIFWTELSCWYRRYSSKATSSLQKSDGRYHDLVERCKISISQMTFGFFLLHIFCVCSIINNNSTGIHYKYMNNTAVYYKKQELLTSLELLDSLPFFCFLLVVSVLSIFFSFFELCFALVLFVFVLCRVCPRLPVFLDCSFLIASVSGLFILGCQCFWIVHSWLLFRFSLTLIHFNRFVVRDLYILFSEVRVNKLIKSGNY